MKLNVLFILMFLVSSLCGAENYYVSQTGNDTNIGTSLDYPLLTISVAMNKAMPGDTIRIGEGRYDEILTTIRNGDEIHPITIDGQNMATVKSVRVANSYHRFYNLQVSGLTNLYGYIFWMRRFGHHTIISNCLIDVEYAKGVMGMAWEISSSDGYPFSTNTSSHNVIISNRVTGILGTTAVNMAGDSNLFYGNYVYDVGQADFIRLWGRTNVIQCNVFSNNFYVTNIGNHMDFMQTFGNYPLGSWGHIFDRNVIDGIEAGQLSQLEGNGVPEIGNWTLMNNIFANIALQASCSIPHMKYYNNVFYKCNTVNGGSALNFGSRAYTIDGVSITNQAHGVRLFNNVFLDCGSSNRMNVGYYSISLKLTNVYSDYNYVGKNGYQPVVEDSLKRPIGDPDGWDGYKWWEPNGINGGDPRFVDVSRLDFHLKEGSFLMDRGTNFHKMLEAVGELSPSIH